MAENLEFRLKVIEDKLSVALDKNEKKAESLGQTLSFAIGGFAAGIALKGVELLSDGFRSLTGFVSDSISASAESEASLKQLQIALAQTGKLTDENVSAFQNLATQLQATTAFEDDAIIANTALIQSMARLDTEGLKRATVAATDLAATFNIDLESASRLIGKAAEGNITAFKKLGVEFNKGKDDAETFANVLSTLESRFGGAAQAQAKTFTGAITQLKNVFGDMQENIGAVITQNPAVIAAFSVLKSIVIGLSESITAAFGKDNNDSVADFFRLIIDGANGLILAVDSIIRVFDIAANAVMGSIRIMALGIVTPIAAVLELAATIPGIGDSFKGAADTATTEMNRLSQAVNTNMQGINAAFSGETELSKLSLKLAEVRTNFDVLYEDIKSKGPELKNNLAVTPTVEDEQTLAKVRELNIALLESENQYFLAKQQLELENDILEQERFGVKSTEQINQLTEFELIKSKIIYDSAIERAKLLATAEERELAKSKANRERDLRDLQAQAKGKNLIRQQDIADQTAFLSTAATLQSSSNKTLAAIGKSAALVQIGINTQKSASSSFAFGSSIGGPALGAAFAAIAVAAGTAQAAKVAGIQGFAGGGVIGGATTGPDNQLATVRTGELVLNGQQQKTLFDAINSGNIGGGDIVIQVDSREIARAVRTQIKSGFVLA